MNRHQQRLDCALGVMHGLLASTVQTRSRLHHFGMPTETNFDEVVVLVSLGLTEHAASRCLALTTDVGCVEVDLGLVFVFDGGFAVDVPLT